MSGHSHSATIKHKKDITDAKRGKLFSKLSRQITIATKEKGGDPETNTTLRMIIEKAKGFNMPKDNIERAIKKGTGELEGENLENVTFEVYGPGGIAVIIEGITDNKNRTLGEIKLILTQYNGKLAGGGSVRWLFERKGVVEVEIGDKNKEELEMLAIESGAEDINWHNEVLDIYTKPEELEKVKKSLEEKGIKGISSLDWVAKEEITPNEADKNKAQRFFEDLDENDSVQEIYSNIKI